MKETTVYQLKKFLRITSSRIENNQLFLNFGYYPESGFEVSCDDTVLNLLCHLIKPITKKQLFQNISNSKQNILQKDIDEALEKLKKSGMLEECTSLFPVTNRYDRHLTYYSMFTDEPSICQEKLKNSTVVLLGMGGIGSWISFCLAGAGVGTIIGVDHDTIELTNLTRQILYREGDVGKIKVEQAANQIKYYNSDIKFIPLNKKMESVKDIQNVISGANLVLLSADTPDFIPVLVNEACMEEKIAWSVTGYVEMHGICGPLIVPGKTACHTCYGKTNNNQFAQLSMEQQTQIYEINNRYQAPSFGPLNCFLSGFQSLEAIKYLTGYESPQTVNTRYIFNSKNMNINLQKFKRNVNCTTCGGL